MRSKKNTTTTQFAAKRDPCEKRQLDAVAALAAGAAETFTSHLALMAGHASSIRENLIAETQAQEDAMSILATAESAGEFVKRLQGIASIAKSGATRTAALALDEEVRDAVRLVEKRFEVRKIAFKLRGLDLVPSVQADGTQLLHCLLNIFQNAFEAMPRGGTVTISASRKVVPGQNFVALDVKDTGPGIEKDIVDRVFDPFFSTKKRSAAMGLGLAVVRSLVNRWGGFVAVSSRPGHGARFRLFVPVARVQPPHRPAHADRKTAGSVLVVDDDADSRCRMKSILRKAGFRVILAENGRDGAALFVKHARKIAVTIIDAVMPEKSGKNMFDDILKVDPAAPVIMTSGFSRDFVRSYVERGVWTFLQKPFDHDQLLAAVKRARDDSAAAASQ